MLRLCLKRWEVLTWFPERARWCLHLYQRWSLFLREWEAERRRDDEMSEISTHTTWSKLHHWREYTRMTVTWDEDWLQFRSPPTRRSSSWWPCSKWLREQFTRYFLEVASCWGTRCGHIFDRWNRCRLLVAQMHTGELVETRMRERRRERRAARNSCKRLALAHLAFLRHSCCHSASLFSLFLLSLSLSSSLPLPLTRVIIIMKRFLWLSFSLSLKTGLETEKWTCN